MFSVFLKEYLLIGKGNMQKHSQRQREKSSIFAPRTDVMLGTRNFIQISHVGEKWHFGNMSSKLNKSFNKKDFPIVLNGIICLHYLLYTLLFAMVQSCLIFRSFLALSIHSQQPWMGLIHLQEENTLFGQIPSNISIQCIQKLCNILIFDIGT